MYTLYNGDCLEEMKKIPNGSVDLVLTDPPYGTMTKIRGSKASINRCYKSCKWDSMLPIDKMFEEINRVLRPNGKCILFSQEPFTSNLITSTPSSLTFCYRGIWLKTKFGNILLCKSAMCSKFEDFLVFQKKCSKYDLGGNSTRSYFEKVYKFIGLNKKQIIEKIGQCADHCFRFDSLQYDICTEKTYNKLISVYHIDKMSNFISYINLKATYDEFQRETLNYYNNKYPSIFNLWEGKGAKSNVLEYKKDSTHYHPTQKPVLLLEDLIKTFSNDGDTVLDFCMGSGSTIVACLNTNRNAIGIELDENYFKIAEERIEKVNNSIFNI